MICKGKGSIILVINNRLVENILLGFWFWDLAFAGRELEGIGDSWRVLESLGRGWQGRRGWLGSEFKWKSLWISFKFCSFASASRTGRKKL